MTGPAQPRIDALAGELFPRLHALTSTGRWTAVVLILTARAAEIEAAFWADVRGDDPPVIAPTAVATAAERKRQTRGGRR